MTTARGLEWIGFVLLLSFVAVASSQTIFTHPDGTVAVLFPGAPPEPSGGSQSVGPSAPEIIPVQSQEPLAPAVIGAATYVVTVVTGNRFSPTNITINAGDTIIWTNVSSPHTVTNTSSVELFCGVGPPPDGVCTVTFTTPGVYTYQCAPHASVGMTGMVTVVSAASVTLFEGVNFDEDGANGGFYHIPPDPIGAAGSNHVVSVVNTSIEWHTKAGVQESSKRLGRNATTVVGSFFESLVPTNSLFDPKVIYDQYAGRFVVVALEKTDTASGDSTNTSRILLAVSATDDPGGTWYFSSYNGKLTISSVARWADYPGIAVDEEALYLTANMFSFGAGGSYGGSRLWIINKQSIYTNGTPVFTVHDPFAEVGESSGGTLQPAHVFGAGGIGTTNGTFMLNSGWADGSGNDFLLWIRADNPLTSPSFTGDFVSLGGNIHTPVGTINVPQRGTNALIEAGDSRMYHAVWRSNNLYAVNMISPPSGADAAQATAHWYQISTADVDALSLTDQGDVDGEDIGTNTHTFYPSIAVDFRGNIAIGFAASGSNIFAGAYYTGRETADAAGTVQPAAALATGLDRYYRVFSGTRNRWGDYSGISLDPETETIFWVFNQYTITRGTTLSGQDGRWGTRWGAFTFNNNPVAVTNVIVRAGTNSVKVATSTLLANDTDPDGDSLSVSSVSSTSTNGGAVSILGSFVFYTPVAGYTGVDSFTYTISDGRGGTYTTNVLVQVPTDNNQSENHTITMEGSNFRIRFHGIPGRSYLVQFAPSVPSTSWTTLSNMTASALGIFEYVDTNGPPARFFRSIAP